jgi:hypothetical protein
MLRPLFRFAAALLLTCASSGLSYARGFLPAVNYGLGNSPESAVGGDFNGDGRPDLAVADRLDSTVTILLGRGDGTFDTTKILAVGQQPIFIAAGDFNGDGRPDLVTANAHDGTVSVILNSYRGFLHAATYASGGHGPRSLVTGDFDRDGKLDVVVADSCDPDCQPNRGVVTFLKGNGDGTFQVVGSYDAASSPEVTVAGDFNGDGKLDLAVADFDGGVNIIIGNGDGGFQQPVNYSPAVFCWSVAVGDFNGDGNLDLVLAGTSTTVSVLLGKGDGTFGAAVEYHAGPAQHSVAVGDFNGNGNLDIVVTTARPKATVTVLLGKGDGSFLAGKHLATDQGPWFVTVADLNHDRAADLVVVNDLGNDVSILMNSSGTFVTTTSSENPAPVGQSVTFTAAVAPSLGSTIPTGLVSFVDGTTILATVPLDQNGQGSFTTSSLSLGTHTIRTGYSGDPNFNPNTGKAIMQIIQ